MQNNVIKPVFPQYNIHLALNRPLRSCFISSDALLEIVFKMEDDDIIFIGDLIQLSREQIHLYTKNENYTDRMIDYIHRSDLTIDRVVGKWWARPSTFGIRMEIS